MSTNNLIFKGIQQVKALPTNPEKGVIYFVREHNGDKLTGNAKVYFGSRLYGEVNETKLAELQAAITANADAIEVINGKLGKWTEDLGTVANAVVANQNSINNLTTATTKNIADAKAEAINTATGYTNTQIDSVNKTLTAYTATTNTTLTGLRTDINTVSGATKTNASNIQALSGIVTNNATAATEAIEDAIDTATGYTKNQIDEVKELINNKNVSATGDTYINATASGNKVTVSATDSTKASLALADSAVQTVVEGSTNGTIKVDGTPVAVHGLGSAAYTEASAYDASGAAATVKTDLLGDAGTNYNTLGKLEDEIQKVAAVAKSYAISAVTVSGEENVKEAWGLFDEDGTQAGHTIKIYKDSSLKKVELSGQTLMFTYILSNGSESTVGVDVSAFLSESEYGNGLQVVDHVISVKKDSTSESFLSVSANGIKVSGVQNAINAATSGKADNSVVSALNDVVTAHTGSADIHVTTSDKNKWNAAEQNAKDYADDEVLKVSNKLTAYTATTNTTLTGLRTDVNAVSSTTNTNASNITILSGAVANSATAITNLNSTKLDAATYTTYTASTKNELDKIKEDITSITSNAVTSVAAANSETAITVAGEQEVTVALNVSASEGNMIVKNADGIFAALYYGGDDVE